MSIDPWSPVPPPQKGVADHIREMPPKTWQQWLSWSLSVIVTAILSAILSRFGLASLPAPVWDDVEEQWVQPKSDR